MKNLAEQLRDEKIKSINFQEYLDYVADMIRNGNDSVWFGVPWNGNCKGIQYYTDYNLAEALVDKFRSEGFRVEVLRATGFQRLLKQFSVSL